MRSRVTDGFSFASEFDAINERQFIARCAAAISECRRRGCNRSLQLQVMTPHMRHWMSPNYPRSNGPESVDWSTGAIGLSALYRKVFPGECGRAKSDDELLAMRYFVTEKSAARLSIVGGSK